MNSDERIDALTERTEALTQSVELLSRMHQDNEIQFQGYFDRLTRVMESLAIVVQDHDARIKGLEN